MAEEYVAGTEVKELDIINTLELEDEAKKVIPKSGFGYIRSGAGDEFTLRQNVSSFNHKGVLPRVLADVENPDPSTTFMDIDLRIPAVFAPIAALGIAHEQKEIGVAKAFNEFGSVFSLSSYAGSSFDEVAEAYDDNEPSFFQLYMSKDNDYNRTILDGAKEFGARAIILTADSTVSGNREEDKRNKFVYPFGMPIVESYLEGSGSGMALADIYATSKQKISPEDVRWITEYTDLPVFVKGVQTAEDASVAIGAGAAGVWVSNHGGRQLDGAPGSFDNLEEITTAVGGRVPIVFDSGIRRGEHIFKALASGADIVALGRPILYGLALGGWKGVTSVLEYFEKDFKRVMQLTGCQTIEDVKSARLKDMKF